ncbi:DUF1853 family protein [Marinobacterium sp. xm-d-530]|uniref:DUF1853 family protein n=1 Tax=Marinobacterium sp. xm-d-530 TaxID=2497747 RepID=UPI001567F5A4|nr:DUF1853 family protein [Marinobacterium sp. xm-d-530]NRQ02576.1 hypothetical protein [Marinobacterium sp. xm-d-530]
MKKIVYTTEQIASELAWLSQAQTLVGENKFRRDSLAINPSLIPKLKHHHRLGVHFEDLFELHLKTFPQITDLNSHIQIIDNKKTLGEADFLVCKDGDWQHIEVAIKFYLRVGSSGQMSDYLGPSLTDSLDRKITHIENKQLKLLESEPAKRTLQSVGVDSAVKSYAQIFGWLFYHVSDNQSKIPDNIHPQHPRGRWLCVNELVAFLDEYPDTVRFLIPSRSEWLISPSHIYDIAVSKNQLLKRAETVIDRPQQLFVLLGEGRSRQLVERLFIVPEAWVDKAESMNNQT